MRKYYSKIQLKYLPSKKRRIGIQGEKKVKKVIGKILPKNSYKIFNNFIFIDSKNCSHQIDHILIYKKGIFSIETKNYSGCIEGQMNENKWTSIMGKRKERFSFQNPFYQNKIHVFNLKKLLNNEYEIHSLIVFAKNNTKENAEAGLINLRSLETYIKKYNTELKLTKKEINEIYKKLKKSKIKMSNFEHVKNVKNFANSIKNFICPKCGSKLLQKKGPYGLFYYCSNFKNCDFKKKKKLKTKKPNSPS